MGIPERAVGSTPPPTLEQPQPAAAAAGSPPATPPAAAVPAAATDAVTTRPPLRGIQAVNSALQARPAEAAAEIPTWAYVAGGAAAGAAAIGIASRIPAVRQFAGRAAAPIAEALETAAVGTRRLGNAGKLLLRDGDDAARFADLQRSVGRRMVRVLNEDAAPGLLTRVRNRLFFGSPVEYIVAGESKAAQASRTARQVSGAVFHELPADTQIVRGARGLSASNARAYRFFDNKLNEANFLQRFAPGSIARTESIADVIRGLGLRQPAANATAAERAAFLQQLEAGIRQRYPQGFFIKGIGDFNTGGNLVHNNSGNFTHLYEGFVREYAPARQAVVEANQGARDIPSIIQSELRGHPFAAGRTLDELMTNPGKAIVQERLPLSRYTNGPLPRDVQPFDEFRVHVVNGKAVPGASFHRWSVTQTIDRVDELAKVEQWVDQQFARFPRGVRERLSFAPDIVRLEDGGYRFMELNVGGESGFLYRNPLAANAVTEAVTGRVTPFRAAVTPVAYAARGLSAVTTPVLSGLSRLLRAG